MGSALQFAAFLCICCLIRSVATHSNRDGEKSLNKQLSSSKGPEMEDFYFVEEKSNDDNVKNGRAISQTAWSKEDNEQILPVENKAGTQSSGEFSINNFVSYLLGVVQELKKEIFGLSERTSLKNTEESTNSKYNFEDKDKQTELGENQDDSKSVDAVNTDFKNKNDQMNSNYITHYYQKNGIISTDEDLEDSSDVSDDSSHKPYEGSNIKVARKSEKNIHNFKCMRVKTKPEKYSFNVEKTTMSPTIQTLHEFLKEFGESKENGEHENFKKLPTKSERMEQNLSKPSGKETKQGTALPQSLKTGNDTENNDKDSTINLNQEKGSTKIPLTFAEYTTITSPQDRKEDQKESNQDETVVYSSTGKNSKIRESSDFDTNASAPVRTTVLPSIGVETYASTMFSENPIYQKYQEQITSSKPEDQIKAQKNAKSIKNLNEINEHTTVFTESHKTVSEILNHKESTGAYIFDSEIKESTGKRSTVGSTPTTIPYIEHDLNFEMDQLKTSDSFYIGITIAPTTTENIMNIDNTNKETPDNLNDKKKTDENENSEKSSYSWQDENSSETGKDSYTEQVKVQDVKYYSNPEKSLKNKNLNNTNSVNNSEEEDDDLTTSEATDDLQNQHSNDEIKNPYIKLSTQLQKVVKNNKSLNKSVEIENISPDQEYDSEEKENEDFDIYDELDDTQDFNQNQENDNDGDQVDDDEINLSNTETVLANESQRYIMEEKSEGPYNTFLDYFYKHSNNSYFHSLKNHSSNFYDEM